jgi:hypothetical protein
MRAVSGITLLLFLVSGLIVGGGQFAHAVGFVAESAVPQYSCDGGMLHAGNSRNGIPEAVRDLSRVLSL